MPSFRPSFRPSSLSIPPGASGTRLSRLAATLRSEWRLALSGKHLRADLVAGLSVGIAALPVSLAIALATDVPAGLGLTTAVVAGVIAALTGGTRLGVTGPAAVMAVLVGQIVDRHGLSSLFLVGLVAGLGQLAFGMLGLARFARIVPMSVVRGFTAGIGITLLIGQFPRALGLRETDESHVLDVLVHFVRYASEAHPAAALIAAGVVALALLGRRFLPAWPVVTVAVALAAVLATVLGLDEDAVPRLGAIDAPFSSFGSFVWPGRDTGELLADVVAVFAVGSIEAVYRSQDIARRQPGEATYDSDLELCGQGLANIGAALVGGFPVTNVVARSTLNVDAGARTRLSAVLAALVVLGLGWGLVWILPLVPVAALAGALVAVALQMLSVPYFAELVKTSRSEAALFGVTVASMVTFDVGFGVQMSALVALVAALARVTRARADVEAGASGVPHHATLSGPLTFLATARIDALGRRLERLPAEPGFVIDLKNVDSIDPTAVEHLSSSVEALRMRGAKVAILGANAEVLAAIRASAPNLASMLTTREADLDKLLDRSRVAHGRSQLLSGVKRFRRDVRDHYAHLLAELAAGQEPHTLLLTCADSRVVPQLITGTEPGELFCVRNIGALLPPFGHETLNDEGAALEYAIEVLGVRNVVVCGHSRCGAMSALKKGSVPAELGALTHWAVGARDLIVDPASHEVVDDLTRATTLKQIEHLRSYPVVQRALEAGEITLAAWFYDVERAEVLEWSERTQRYAALGERESRISVDAGAEP
jgi:carbonic anhydrase